MTVLNTAMNTVVFEGDLDIFRRSEIQSRLDLLASERFGIIDLRAVTMIDAAFLGQLAALRKANARAGGTLVLVVCSPLIKKILSIARFDRLFPIVATMEEAILIPASR